MKYFLVVLALCMASCQVVVDVDIPLKAPSMTVNSTINPDSTFHVLITSSQNVLSDGEFALLRGVIIAIYEDDKLVETLIENNNGTYDGLSKPKPGVAYKLEASKPDFETVVATDVIPNNEISLSSVNFEKIIRDEYDQHEYSMSVEFEDPRGTNYYEIGVYGPVVQYDWDKDSGEATIIDTVLLPYYLNSEDAIFDDNHYYADEFWAFSDELVDGKTVEVNFNTHIEQFWDENLTELEVIVVLREISFSLFSYKQTASLQWSLGGNPFAEPVPVYSNITNGYGIFGAYRQSISKVTLTKGN